MLHDLIKLADARASSADPARIKNLGRIAAKRFIEADGGNLTSAVTSVIQEEGDLSREQIRRVAEAANQATWSTQFAGGEGNRETAFDPADVDEILEAAAPPSVDVSSRQSDYGVDPKPRGMDQLLSAFDGEDVGPKYEALDPQANTRELHEKISHVRSTYSSQADLALLRVQEVGGELYEMIKQAHLSGEPMLHIIGAVQHACEDPHFAVDVLTVAGKRLEAEVGKIDMTKQAASRHFVVEEDHPLVKTAAEYENLMRAFVRSSSLRDKAAEGEKRTMSALRDQLRGV